LGWAGLEEVGLGRPRLRAQRALKMKRSVEVGLDKAVLGWTRLVWLGLAKVGLGRPRLRAQRALKMV